MTDVLIIGSGGAGLMAAISAKQEGADVTVVGKSFPTRSQTSMAQGGINAVITTSDDDSVESHIADTLKSAQGLADEDQVRSLCQNAKEIIAWFDRIGVPFSRTSEGKVAQRRLGGAAGNRACYAQDYTGLKILHTLYDKANELGVRFINEHFLLDFILEEKGDARRIGGATFLDIRRGEVVGMEARSVIVATGGYSRVYHGFSTNSTAATGDGLAAAVRAGAHLSDMEFVQFHPTALKNSTILISESARGAGGHLLNAKKERFTDELAPRDVVARAIADEIEQGGEVYLDVRHLGEGFIDHELPQERKLAMIYEDVDPVVDLIPIKPAAHYTMGGIDVDAHGMSCIPGLFAVGEAANSRVHGANRLGGNSLLELAVFGKEVGRQACTFSRENPQPCCESESSVQKQEAWIEALRQRSPSEDFYAYRDMLGRSFYRLAGIKRDGAGLMELLDKIEGVKMALSKMGPKDKSKEYNTNLVEFLEFYNVLSLSEIIVQGAIAREESRGAHYRMDKPQKDDAFAKHTITKKKDGTLCVNFTN